MSKGERTRQQIVDRALELAVELGLEGVTLGVLASDLGLSKSGLFAHFESKEALQLQVLQEASDRFVAKVLKPALQKPRGEPRVRALFEHYIGWIRDSGGCFFLSASHEYDDRPGAVRDALVRAQRDWLAAIKRAAQIAIEERHFDPDLDPEVFAFEIEGIAMAYQHAFKLIDDPKAEKKARAAFRRLIERSARRAR